MTERSPWTILHHDGAEWMVRHMENACWLVRLPERDTYLLQGDNVPAWTREQPRQMEMLG